MSFGAKLAVGAVAFGLAAAPQALGVSAFDSHVGMSDKAPAFHGKVDAESPLCVKHRVVQLLKVKNEGTKVLGSDHTDAAGEWAVLEDQFTLKSGAYRAKVNASMTSTGDRCRKDVSRIVAVD